MMGREKLKMQWEWVGVVAEYVCLNQLKNWDTKMGDKAIRKCKSCFLKASYCVY